MEQTRLVKLAACMLGAILMAAALSSYGWLSAETAGTEAGGGLGTLEACRSDGDCDTYVWGHTTWGEPPGALFRVAGYCTGTFGGLAIVLLILYCGLSIIGFDVQLVSFSDELSLGIAELADRTLLLKFHPTRAAARLGIAGGVFGGMFVFTAPAEFGLSYALPMYVVALVMAIAAAQMLDPRTLRKGADATSAGGLTTARGKPAGDGVKTCVRCGGKVRWVPQAQRRRCTECNTFQPNSGEQG